MTLREAIREIRQIGAENVRIVPINSKKSIIEIYHNSNWVPILKEMSNRNAEDILLQAKNNLILG